MHTAVRMFGYELLSLSLSLIAPPPEQILLIYASYNLYFSLRFVDKNGTFKELYNVLFPQLLYPLKHIAQTASIFMTVAITFERYCAVHYPINYNQVRGDIGLHDDSLDCSRFNGENKAFC